MRAVAQRVLSARVAVDGREVAAIGRGVCVFAAAGLGDDAADVAYIAAKLVGLRVFAAADAPGRMRLGLAETHGGVLLIPQFTLYGDVRRGRRPDFGGAAPPDVARQWLAALAVAVRAAGLEVSEGVFGADMRVDVVNDGPVTVLLDSRRLF